MGYSILIVDDHELFSTALRMSLRDCGLDAYQVRPEDRESIVRRAGEITPGLVVLDLDLGMGAGGRLSGLDVVAELRSLGWKVLIVSGSLDPMGTGAAVAAGAVGAVSKSSSFDSLLHTVVRASAGQALMSETERQSWLARHRTYQATERELTRRMSQLSRRERAVLDLLAEGHRAAAIAEQSVVSMTTVRTQIRSILAKLEVNSQLEAVALLRQYPQSRA